MRRMMLGFCCLAFVGPLPAQDGATKAPAKDAGPACHNACPAKVCVSEPTTKKTSKTVFSSKCVEFCLPKCSGVFSRGCDNCAENCGPVRTVNVLLKKVVTEECPSTHCVVRDGPACTTTATAATPAPKKK